MVTMAALASAATGAETGSSVSRYLWGNFIILTLIINCHTISWAVCRIMAAGTALLYTWTNGGLRNYYWNNVGGGDGFDVSPDPEDNNWVYSMSQGGALGKVNVATGEDMNLKPPTPDTGTRLRFNWNAAFAQDPFDAKTIYYGRPVFT